MSTIHLIGGEKGGVGKSVVARLASQFCIDRSLPFVAVDADLSHGALKRFYRDYSKQVDLAFFESADQILDLAFEEQRRVLVDLPAQSDRLLATWIGQSGVLDLAAESQVPVVIWHVLDDGKDSLVMLDRLLDRYQSAARYCVVKNHGRGKDFSLYNNSTVRATAGRFGAKVLDLPELHAPVMQKMDRLDASFWAAIHGTVGGADGFSRIERQRVRVWLEAAYRELERLGDLF
jgi:hypothetical protein